MGLAVLYATPSPVVNITSITQHETSRKVNISYNLSHTMPVTVTLQVSADNGVTWNLPCTLVTGDIGANISPGNGKHIVWDVLAEHPNVIYENVRFKVIADDGQSPPIPPEFILVQGGTFNPTTNYTVTLSSYYISKFEVTQSEYQSIMNENPSVFVGFPQRPVERVNWFKAIEYCNRRSLLEGLAPCFSYSDYGTNPNDWPQGWSNNNTNHLNMSCDWNANGYRLPTEMEWMYAAKGGQQSLGYTYSGSNITGNVAWFSSNSSNRTHDIGTKVANELGTYDMSGNVREWCWDIQGSYPVGAITNPKGPVSGTLRMGRGGGWNLSASYCTVSSRDNYAGASSAGNGNFGIRLVRNAH